ncbi:hypothetical protein [Quadrisphaera sp. INWT6]|uniref:HAAS signaling domain-containing protein n=1 Tax=Quadrisphaera sp. INWT6 TaxID=2596917 RepID=UPI0018925753|nr:hypothetical protein [Quadrisphaera sp. INWT6]MBF5082637.1 hypothetical protein [Quadrisphaera sp. INWT6]
MSPRPAVVIHPLVHAYLSDLGRALAGADPRERADVLDGVREHLDEALGDGAPVETADVRRVLADLGPVEAIAAQATRAELPAPPTSSSVASPAAVAPASDTTSLVALITAIVASAVFFIPFVSIPLAVASLVTAAVHLRRPGARKGRCWAAVAVASATLLLMALAAALLLSVEEVGTLGPGTVGSATSVTSAPAE